MVRCLRLFLVVAAIGLLPKCFADTLTYSRLQQNVVEAAWKRRRHANARLQALKEKFLHAGCAQEQLKEQPLSRGSDAKPGLHATGAGERCDRDRGEVGHARTERQRKGTVGDRKHAATTGGVVAKIATSTFTYFYRSRRQ